MISYPELKAMGVPFTPFYIRRMVREGRFPKPIKGGRSRALGPFQWREGDIKKYLKTKAPAKE